MIETPTYPESDSVVLPSGAVACCSEITGQDQAALSSRNADRNGSISAVLSRRVTLDGEKLSSEEWNAALECDRVVALVHLRRVSFGNEVEVDVRCQECDAKTRHIVEFTEEDYRRFTPPPHGSRRRIIIEARDRHFAADVRTGEVDERAIKARGERDVLTLLRARRLQVVDGPDAKLDQEVRRPLNPAMLTAREIAVIERALMAADAMPDFSVEIECPACGAVAKVDARATPGFFFPHLIEEATPARTPSSSPTEA
ncbi:MAG: hypothetical protein RLY93_12290 [Sumerlaeia bacterium]